MNICLSVFFPLLYKRYNKLDEYIYTYFFDISIILSKYFFYKLSVSFKKTTNICIFIFNQNQNFIKKYRS